MAEGLYRGWDELRTVPSGQQSGLRVIVLFTDGSGNIVPGLWDASGIAKGLFNSDFPERQPIRTTSPRTARQSRDSMTRGREQPVQSGSQAGRQLEQHDDVVRRAMDAGHRLTPMSSHQHHRSGGIPTAFPLSDQRAERQRHGAVVAPARLRNFNTAQNRYPAEVFNIRNAATNLTEIIANAARSDNSRRLSDPHLHDRHGRAGHVDARHGSRRRPRAC